METASFSPFPASDQNPPGVKGQYHFLKYHLAPLALFLGLALIFTWPLPLHLSDRVINPRETSADVWQHLWNAWWMRFSLLDLHVQPFYSPMIFWPSGANLYFHALDPLDGYLSVPFQLLFGLVPGFNLVFFIQLTLAGYAAYRLALQLSGNFAPALVAGIIYAFCPLESVLLNLGQVELTSIAWLPFYMLFFIKTLNKVGGLWRNAAGAVLFLLALALDSWYYTLYALLFSGLYLLYFFWLNRQNWRKVFLPAFWLFGGILGVWGLLISPVLLPTIREANSGGNRQELWKIAYNSADLLGFLQPGPSAVWGLLGSGASAEYRGNFGGLFALAAALLGILKNWARTGFWFFLGLVFGLLALGPVLHLRFEDWDPKTALQGLPLPGQLLYLLPFGNIARVPLRFGLVLMLALAVCAAFGLDWLTRFFQTRPVSRRFNFSWLVPLVAGALIFLEFLPVPRALVETTIPTFYSQLRAEGQWPDFAILEMPDAVTTFSMYYQTEQQHPILNAYLSRRPDYNFEQTPGIRELRTLKLDILRRDILDRNAYRNVPEVLAYYKIRYVILHPAFLKGKELDQAQEVLEASFGDTPPFYQDQDLKVWKVAPLKSPPDPSNPALLATFGNGWKERDNGPGKEPFRATFPVAEVNLFNPQTSPLLYELAVPVRSNLGTKALEVRLNGQLLNEQLIGLEVETLKVPLTLKAGPNQLTFKLKDAKPDSRETAFIFGSIKFNLR